MRPSLTVCVLSMACLTIGFAASGAAAADIAYDNAANSAYGDGWQNGDNGGYGFQPWQLSTLNSGSWGIADSSTGDPSWWISTATPGNNGATASRSFAALSDHGGLSFDIAGNTIPSSTFGSSSFAVSIGDSSGFPFVISVQPTTANSGSEDYQITDSSGHHTITNIVADGSDVHVDFDLNGSESVVVFGGLHVNVPAYTVTLDSAGYGSYTYSGPLVTPGVTLGAINTIVFAAHSSGTNPLYFNNLAVVPIPAAAAGAMPLLGLLVVARRRRTTF